MENVPQQQKQKQSKGVSPFAALAGMLVTFVAGIFLGLHPAWIPIGSGNSGELNPASVKPIIPATEPATAPAPHASTSGI